MITMTTRKASGTVAQPARNCARRAAQATPGEVVRNAARRLASARGLEFRREFDTLIATLANPEARGTLDASVLLEAEGPIDDYFSKEAATVLTNEIAWSDGDQEFADWAIRARERWASNLAEFARLEIAAMGPGSPPAVRLAAMALAGQGEAIKWRAIAGRRARDLHALHETYRIVETAGIARNAVRVRLQGQTSATTPEALYVRALLFDALCAGALSRREMIIVDDWLLQWSGDFRVTAEPPAEKCPVAIGVHGAGGLEPCARTAGAATRYVAGLPRLRERIGETRAAFHEGRIVARTRHAADLPVEHHVSALARLDELLGYWANPEAAREKRSPLEGQPVADLFIGLGEIVARAFGPYVEQPREGEDAGRTTAAAEDSARADRHSTYGMVLEPIGRRATVVDRSAHGLGLSVTRLEGGHPLMGDVVAIRMGTTLKVGRVVRRYADPATDRLRIGVRILIDMPARVKLVAAVSGGSRTTAETTALFVPGQDPQGRFDALLVSRATFQATGPFEMTLGATTYTIRFVRDQVSGRGWVAARFEVLGAKGA